eukprot:30932-Pelagococcus_subviridis.AAC.1
MYDPCSYSSVDRFGSSCRANHVACFLWNRQFARFNSLAARARRRRGVRTAPDSPKPAARARGNSRASAPAGARVSDASTPRRRAAGGCGRTTRAGGGSPRRRGGRRRRGEPRGLCRTATPCPTTFCPTNSTTTTTPRRRTRRTRRSCRRPRRRLPGPRGRRGRSGGRRRRP